MTFSVSVVRLEGADTVEEPISLDRMLSIRFQHGHKKYEIDIDGHTGILEVRGDKGLTLRLSTSNQVFVDQGKS